MKNRRNLFIGLLVVAVVIAGIVLIPKTAAAAETETVVKGENGIIFVQDTDNLNIKDYWTQGKAPVRTGYVFAGWYSDSNENSALSKDGASEAETAWAKFVPDYVLSVRAQIEATTEAGDGATAIRVLSSVDTDVYQKVGFDIYLANKHRLTMTDENGNEVAPLATEKAFSKILVNGNSVEAKDTFGDASKYFVVWKLTEIKDINDSKIIYVRPYWVTYDGTTVYGLAKYVHVEDGYLGYINVPINLMTGEAIAAGIVNMEYSGLTFVGFEEGRLLPEMAVNYSTDGIIRMAANAEKVDDVVTADGIYANLRFKKPGTTDPNTLIETPKEGNFSGWDEEDFAITPIIQY